ncbi:concanavalin A-like lectin/glucanase domain-containing protein [Aspergillus multicolor]|uniref:glycoside hydrolase family 16 protein n=1 Tax=Aspergillus multicolor TaxID=41759 RepID=UPI003CCCCA08
MRANTNMKWQFGAIAVATAIRSVAGQTYTDCNPTEETCSADTGLAQWSFTTDFTSGDSAFDSWNVTSGSVPSTSLGAEFTINQQGDAPTIETDFYIFFGYVEVKMRAANGTGIISTAILESDDLDEIDWEQISTFDNQISTNYFGKGNTTSYDRATTVSVTNPIEEFHTYGISWTESKTEWYVDGTLVRTLNYADAVDGTNYPQTPMRVRIGIWAGGDPDNSEGTIEWAGGETDYSAAPFTMYVESVSITNYNPAESYTWTDQTGDYTSISKSNGTSGEGETLSGTGSTTISSVTFTTTVSTTSTTLSTTSSGESETFTPTLPIPSTPAIPSSIPISSPALIPPAGTTTSSSTSSSSSSSTDSSTGSSASGTDSVSSNFASLFPTSGASSSLISPTGSSSISTTPATSTPTTFFNASPGVLSVGLGGVLGTVLAVLMQF